MAISTSYTNARANLTKLCNEASKNREIVFITRRNEEDVALIAVSELRGLLETAHLLRSPKNAERLLTALNRARANTETPQTLEALRKELGFEKEA